jgi:hypothetical protein
MDWLTFTTEITKTLVWPIVVLALLCVFREHIRRLVGSLTKLKWGGAEAQLARSLIEAEEDRAAALSKSKQVPDPHWQSEFTLKIDDALRKMATHAAILQTWPHVEREARDAARRAKVEVQIYQRPSDIVESLVRNGLLDPSWLSLYSKLRSLRNQVAHLPEFEPSEDAVDSFLSMCKDLTQALRAVPERN